MMSFKQSNARQAYIEKWVKAVRLMQNYSTVVLHEFPKWSIYTADDPLHSGMFDCFTNAAIYKMLKAEAGIEISKGKIERV